MRNVSIIILLGLSALLYSCDNSGAGGAPTAGDMTTTGDSISYLVGSENAKQLKQLGFELNPETFYQGFKASTEGADLALSPEAMAQLSLVFQQRAQEAQQAEQLRTNVGDGEVAPDLTMATPDGENMSISDLRGKYVLIDFWASWCKPCRQENPNVVRVYNKYKDQGFEILGVSLDNDRDKWLAAIQQDGLTWEHMSDLKQWGSESVAVYGFKGIPYTVLIDPEGKIVAQHLRSAGLEAALAGIFGS